MDDPVMVKVMAFMQARLQSQLLNLFTVVSSPIPGVPLGKQWADLNKKADEKLEEVSEIGNQQIALFAELAQSANLARAGQIRCDLFQMDGLIQARLSQLWSAPPDSET